MSLNIVQTYYFSCHQLHSSSESLKMYLFFHLIVKIGNQNWKYLPDWILIEFYKDFYLFSTVHFLIFNDFIDAYFPWLIFD